MDFFLFEKNGLVSSDILKGKNGCKKYWNISLIFNKTAK